MLVAAADAAAPAAAAPAADAAVATAVGAATAAADVTIVVTSAAATATISADAAAAAVAEEQAVGRRELLVGPSRRLSGDCAREEEGGRALQGRAVVAEEQALYCATVAGDSTEGQPGVAGDNDVHDHLHGMRMESCREASGRMSLAHRRNSPGVLL